MRVNKFIILLTLVSCLNAERADSSTVFENNKKKSCADVISPKGTDSIYSIDSITCGLNFNAGENYQNEKHEIERQRKKFAELYALCTDSTEKIVLLDSIKNYFTNSLLNKIIPYWYGTLWDFDGYTSVPNNGYIACGYFVSTTLRDMGLKVNRYRLAQQAPENEAISIACDSSKIAVYSENEIIDTLKKINDGLYFCGLYNHVGYLYIKNNNPYFIHSNYIDGKVMAEDALHSEAFNSNIYYVTEISSNMQLLLSWLTKEDIKVAIE